MSLLDGGKANRVLVNGRPMGEDRCQATDDFQIGRTLVRS